MTNNLPEDIKKKFSSLAVYIRGTREQLLNIIAYVENVRKRFLFYQLAAPKKMAQKEVDIIRNEMNEWPREMRTRTERVFEDFQKERRLLGADFPETLREQLVTVAFLFLQVLKKSDGKKSGEESLDNFELLINRLQEEPTSKEVLNQVKEALENIHHVFVRLLDAVHREEKDLIEEEEIVDQISGNTFIEENKDKILITVKKVFHHFLEDYPYLKYGTLLNPLITANIRREVVDHRQTAFLTVTITLEGEVGRPSWDVHLRYDARGHFFEGVFGQRRGFQYIPEEHHSYISTKQMIREFPPMVIQYLFNSEIMTEIIKKQKS